MKHLSQPLFRSTLVAVSLVLMLALPWTAMATVWTDQEDYAPGDVVTISGDNSDNAGYLAGETINVSVVGPNAYSASCDAIADENGAWSCQVTLPPDESAEGLYTYTGVGQTSGVSQSGTFTDRVWWVTITSPTSGRPVTVTSLPADVEIAFRYCASPEEGTTGEARVEGFASSTKPLSGLSSDLCAAGWQRGDTIIVTIPAGTANGSYNAWVEVTNPAGDPPPQQTDSESNAVIVAVGVPKLDPVITWADPADIVHGTALSGTQLDATADVPGTFVYSPSAGTVLNAGAGQTLHVDFTPDDTANYNNASADVTINVSKADPVISWADPADIVLGTALSGTQLNATADVPGTFVYSPPAGTVLNVGAGQTLHVDFTPDDTANYNNASADVTINVLYAFTGFFRPVDMPDTLNLAKAGSAIPVKFSLSGDQGLDIFKDGYPKSQRIDCELAGWPDDIEETVTAGGSSLSYDASEDQYVYVWKTDKAWAGTCRTLDVVLDDDTLHYAYFKFR